MSYGSYVLLLHTFYGKVLLVERLFSTNEDVNVSLMGSSSSLSSMKSNKDDCESKTFVGLV